MAESIPPVAAGLSAATSELAKADFTAATSRSVQEARQMAHVAASANHKELQAQFDAMRAPLQAQAVGWGTHFPSDWIYRDSTDRELGAPWLDEEWNAARSWLFIAALSLHKAFVLGAGPRMSANLSAAVDLLDGRVPTTARGRAHRLAESVPHGVGRVDDLRLIWSPLQPLTRESVGWLFV